MATPAVNLLPREMRRPRRRVRRAWGWVILAAVLFFALTAYDVNLWLTAAGLSRQADALDARTRSLAPNLKEVQNLQRRTAELEALQGRYRSLRGEAWSLVWANLSRALPAGVELQQIGTTEHGVAMTCGAGSLPLAAAAEDGLAAVPGVSGVSLAAVRSDRPGHFVFVLQVVLTGGTPPGAPAADKEGRATP